MPVPIPTDGELAILTVLWDRGPSTVKDIHRVISTGKETAYTTILRMCQIMCEKGLVTRDESERQHVYAPAVPRDGVRRELLDDLLEKAFQGSAKDLVVQALADARPDAAELDEIQAFLEKLRRGRS